LRLVFFIVALLLTLGCAAFLRYLDRRPNRALVLNPPSHIRLKTAEHAGEA